MEPSDNSEEIKYPLKLRIIMTLDPVVDQQDLVQHQRGQQLRPVVPQPGVPDVLVEPEQVLEPAEERLDRLAPPLVERAPLFRPVEPRPLRPVFPPQPAAGGLPPRPLAAAVAVVPGAAAPPAAGPSAGRRRRTRTPRPGRCCRTPCRRPRTGSGRATAGSWPGTSWPRGRAPGRPTRPAARPPRPGGRDHDLDPVPVNPAVVRRPRPRRLGVGPLGASPRARWALCQTGPAAATKVLSAATHRASVRPRAAARSARAASARRAGRRRCGSARSRCCGPGSGPGRAARPARWRGRGGSGTARTWTSAAWRPRRGPARRRPTQGTRRAGPAPGAASGARPGGRPARPAG